MTTWNLTVSANLDRAPTEHEALTLGKSIAGEQLLMVSTHADTARLTVHATSEKPDALAALTELRDAYADVLAARGYSVQGWETLECLTEAELERRAEASTVPPMVPAAQLAEMCGVSTQRVYELESERRKAAEAGEAHPFPTPVVPGWWLRAAAERYASTRKRKPGPARGE